MNSYRNIKLFFLGAFFTLASAAQDDGSLLRVAKQAHRKAGAEDQSSAETGFGGGGVEHSKYFQEMYTLQSGPKQIEFGHVCENPDEWEQRYERKDFDQNRHQGKPSAGLTRGFKNFTIMFNPELKAQKDISRDAAKKQTGSYQHLPEHDKYEFGYRRGNDHHVRERYEKAVPHEGHFKTKVRWADKKGGHGEHYWDYNHAGHHDDGEGGYSDPVPTYTDSQRPSPISRVHQKRQLEAEPSTERRHYTEEIPQPDQKPQPSQDFYALADDSSEKDGFVKSFEDEIGGIETFEIQKESTKQKRQPVAPPPSPPQEYKPEIRSDPIRSDPIRSVNENRSSPARSEISQENLMKAQAQRAGREIKKSGNPQLFFDLESGKVIDENTGKTYMLQPLN